MTKQFLRLLALVLFVSTIFIAGCTSTRNQNGVQIEQQRSLNPIDYIPFL
ncbi:MAG: Uncharacterised protein [Opitutia bacterium UBA7350]|nr:MAG: Uncharacterised protein [Opitutae bacterium UBA7350]